MINGGFLRKYVLNYQIIKVPVKAWEVEVAGVIAMFADKSKKISKKIYINTIDFGKNHHYCSLKEQ